MRLLYTTSILCYQFFIFIASFFNTKAKLWTKGRKYLFQELQEKYKDKERIYCFHCASLGEFEQGKPLMQKIKNEHPEITVMVTFFSPSGYEVKKDDPIADIITYLPVDTRGNMIQFLNIVKPEAFFFIKYEYWYNLMAELATRNIPFYYVSAIFRPKQHFFKSWGKWFANSLKKANYFFVQNSESKELLESIGIYHAKITGDTRFDRVYAIANQQYELDFVIAFKKSKRLLVAGSTWEKDETVLREVFDRVSDKYQLIIAPHLVDKKHILEIKEKYAKFNAIAYSEAEDKDLSEYQVLIIDKIGLLSKIYKYSNISYVGGAFGTGLHNILEPAVFGVPIFFGPEYEKFNEAVELIKAGGAFSIQSSEEIISKLILFASNENEYKKVCDLSKEFVQKNLGAVDKIYNTIKTLKP